MSALLSTQTLCETEQSITKSSLLHTWTQPPLKKKSVQPYSQQQKVDTQNQMRYQHCSMFETLACGIVEFKYWCHRVGLKLATSKKWRWRCRSFGKPTRCMHWVLIRRGLQNADIPFSHSQKIWSWLSNTEKLMWNIAFVGVPGSRFLLTINICAWVFSSASFQ